MENSFITYAIGFLAQIFFAARTLLQWLKSEKARTVVSPSAYWVFSVLGAYLLCLYGWLRNDFSIILGQFISYYIYLWNLNSKGVWKRLYPVVKALLVATPVAAALFAAGDAERFVNEFFRNEDIPFGMIIFGSAGQIIFTLRFVYQWAYSMKKKESSLPAGFWIISLVGSGAIVAYGIFRSDPVLILGQSFGFVAYCRNLVIMFRTEKAGRMEQ